VISKLEPYNDKAKKLFCEKIWKHRSLRQFQPLGFAMNASIGVAVLDMKESLQIVNTTR
jgi:hypothetical protein